MLASCGLGVSYLAVCDVAVGEHADEAAEAAAGIRAVLSGESDRFAMDYPCATIAGPRWFSMRVTRAGELGGGAVVTHLDITEVKAGAHGGELTYRPAPGGGADFVVELPVLDPLLDQGLPGK